MFAHRLAAKQIPAPAEVSTSSTPQTQTGSSDGFDAHAQQAYVAQGSILVQDSVPMNTPGQGQLSVWMQGTAAPDPQLRPAHQGKPTSDKLVVQGLGDKLQAKLDDANIPATFVAEATRNGFTEQQLSMLLGHGAGPQTMAFLHYAQPYFAYRKLDQITKGILVRWGDKAEVAFEKLNQLCRSDRLKNPEELKSWFMGMASKNIAADGYATMIDDAVDLIEAGHDIFIEETPKGWEPPGLGDILDLTENIAYQHKRVVGSGLDSNIAKAIKQLAGFKDVAAAPEGFKGVAQIDARDNDKWVDVDDDFIAFYVQTMNLGDTSRLDEVQVVFDDRMLVFGSSGKLDHIVRPDGTIDDAADVKRKADAMVALDDTKRVQLFADVLGMTDANHVLATHGGGR